MDTKSKKLNVRALKAGVWYIFNNVLIKGLSIITVPIFSRILTQEEYGIVNNFQSWINVLTIIISLDLYSSIQRAKLDFEEDIDNYLSSILTLSTISSIIFYIFTFIFDTNVKSVMGMDRNMINFVFLYIIFFNAFNFIQTKYRCFMKYKAFTVISIVTSILSIVLSLVLVNAMEIKYWARILGITLPLFIVGVYYYFNIMSKGKKFINKKYWKYALLLSGPLILHHLAGNLLSQFDRIMIANICNFEQVGLYGMAYNVASLLAIVWTSFNGAWTPWFYEQMKLKEYKQIKFATEYYIGAFWIITVMLLAFSPEILSILAPKEYYEARFVIPPVLLGLFFQFIYSLYVNIEFYEKNNKYIPIGTILSAGINIILNAIFIPKYGYIAAAITTFIGYLFLFIFHYFIAKKLCKVDIYPKKKIFFFIISMCGISLLYYNLYNFIIIRYIVTVVVISVVILFKGKEFIRFTSKFKR